MKEVTEIYESLGTYYINHDLSKDKILDNKKRIKPGTYWVIDTQGVYGQTFLKEYGDYVLLRVYKRRPSKQQGDFLIISKNNLNKHFIKIERRRK